MRSCPIYDADLHEKRGENSTSRYEEIIICSKCGLREALEGNFCINLSTRIKQRAKSQLGWKY